MPIEISPRPASAARHPPGPSPRSCSRPSGRKAQGPPRSPSRRRPRPAAGAGTGLAIPPLRSAVPQASRAPWGIPPSGASGSIFKLPTFTPNGVAEPNRRSRRQSTDRHVRSRRHLGHAPIQIILKGKH
ncbi:hypothetical protein NDU88_003729 [Pleurodeles waltl]|uniref:Uncharacterized protein n=1 Tax=Pleurodeles waltl TaxID=8319 RepID=A0AAV7NRP5_PLEWA|nr:hypothetical protein NDU88_003729 [Pleurodeles waltl]